MKLAIILLASVASALKGGDSHQKHRSLKKSGGGKASGEPTVRFYENSEDDSYIGNDLNPAVGDRVLWANTPATLDQEATHVIGSTSGRCDIVAVDPVLYYCIYQVAFDGGCEQDRLTFEGIGFDYGVAAPGIYTITGGSGDWSGATGYVYSYSPNGDASDPYGFTFRNEIYIEA